MPLKFLAYKKKQLAHFMILESFLVEEPQINAVFLDLHHYSRQNSLSTAEPTFEINGHEASV